MSKSSAQLILILQSVHPKDGSTSPLVAALVEKVSEWLSEKRFWSPPFERTAEGSKKPAVFESLQAMQLDARQWTDGSYTLRTHEDAAEVDVLIGTDSVDLQCAVPVARGKTQDVLSLVDLSLEIWRAVAERALIGPVFSIRPLGLPYPRPRPPRHSPRWPLGDAAYFISDEFHRVHPLGDPQGIARLKAKPLNPSIVRESQDGLTVIRVSGPADDGEVFARQRNDLEVWMSKALELPLHPEFRENGDRRMGVLPREGTAAPFTFYDAMRRIGFKAVAEGPSGGLDESMRRELERTLKVDKLNDGRPVTQTMVIFPSREAALKNAAVVAMLGGAGSVYVGDDRRLWNPQPPGYWIDVAWETV